MIMKKTMIMRAAMMLCMVVALVGCSNKDSYPYRTDYLPVQLPGSEKWSILDVNSGELVAKDAFANVPSPVIDGMFYVMNDNGTFNYYNVEAPTTPVNKEAYGSVTVFSEDGLAVASKRGGSLCVIDKNCNVVKELPKEVSQCSMFSHGMAAYQNDLGKWGFIDAKGDTVIPAQYAQANLFINEDCAVVIDERLMNDTTMSFSVIDKSGKELFNADASQYRPIQPYYVDGVLPVVKHNGDSDTIVFLNKEGQETTSPNEDDHEAVNKADYLDAKRTAGGNFIVMNKEKKMGLVDKDNNVLIDIKHQAITDVRKDRYIILKDSLFSLVNEKGEAVGNVKFVHAHGGSEAIYATRGFIDVNMAAASMLMMVGPDNCAGAVPGTTLLDMNSLLDPNPANTVGQNVIGMPQGPFIVRYMFDKEIASVVNDVPAYNNDARVVAADVSLNVANLALSTEADIVNGVSSAMGTKGFVLGDNQMFYNETGQAITIGYSEGVVTLCFFMDRNMAKPLPRNPRK